MEALRFLSLVGNPGGECRIRKLDCETDWVEAGAKAGTSDPAMAWVRWSLNG